MVAGGRIISEGIAKREGIRREDGAMIPCFAARFSNGERAERKSPGRHRCVTFASCPEVKIR